MTHGARKSFLELDLIVGAVVVFHGGAPAGIGRKIREIEAHALRKGVDNAGLANRLAAAVRKFAAVKVQKRLAVALDVGVKRTRAHNPVVPPWLQAQGLRELVPLAAQPHQCAGASGDP